MGLTSTQAHQRLVADGPNAIDRGHRRSTLRLLIGQFTSPIILILMAATALSMVIGDPVDGVVILGIILASGAIGFWQERRATQAVAALASRVHVRVEVLRDGIEVSVPVDEVVRGDVVQLRAGDIVPADARMLDCQSLLVDDAALTGESYPVEKAPAVVAAEGPPTQRPSAVFAGTYVVSGTGQAIVQATGRATVIGSISSDLAHGEVTTRFEQGATSFGRMLVWVMLALVGIVLVIDVLMHRPVVESVLFALALAVGITPQLLPAIVAVSLSVGARRMAHERVLVKRLDAAYDLRGHASGEVLRLAILNATLQQAFGNPLDEALIRAGAAPEARCLAELPYDFHRKRLSVLVDDTEGAVLIVKGAFDQVLSACDRARVGGSEIPIEQARPFVERHFADLVGRRFRVLALAIRSMPAPRTITAQDEAGLLLVGLLAFQDPVKDSAAVAIADLRELGIRVIVITGDNRLATQATAVCVGLRSTSVITGAEVAAASDAELMRRLRSCEVCAEIEPLQKE